MTKAKNPNAHIATRIRWGFWAGWEDARRGNPEPATSDAAWTERKAA